MLLSRKNESFSYYEKPNPCWLFNVTSLRINVKVTYLGIRSAHERVWLVERKPIWLPQAYLTRGDLEPARGNLHACKFLWDLTNIQIRTVTAERVGFVLSALPDERVTTQGRKERTGRRERKTAGRRTREKAREKEQLTREREKAREKEQLTREREKAREKEQLTRERERVLDSIRPETNNSVLSWINTRISFLLPFTLALDNNKGHLADVGFTIWNFVLSEFNTKLDCIIFIDSRLDSNHLWIN